MHSIRRILFGLAILAAVLGFDSPQALAHTGFESSDPADGAILSEPVEVVTLIFTGQAEPTGEGFLLLDPGGAFRAPTSETTVDGLTWELRFDPPVAGGTAGVRWTVKAPDAHPIEGSFSFTVVAPAAADVAAETEAAAPPAASIDDAAPERAPTTEVGPAFEPTTSATLDEFLATDGEVAPRSRQLGALGRVVGLVGTLVGVGALVFALAVLRGDPRDVRHVLFWVRRAGALAVLGSVIELVAQIGVEAGGSLGGALSPSTIGSVVFSSFGLSVALRLGGGITLATGAKHRIADAAWVDDPIMMIKERVSVGAGGPIGIPDRQNGWPSSLPHEPYSHAGDHAWAPDSDSRGALVGASALLAAFLFDGHTVSQGNRFLTALVDLIHVIGGSVWAGGVLMLAAVVWRRHRQGRELRALQLAIRFSIVATLALVAVGAGGLLLTVTILDSVSELWSTEWGRYLVAKVLVVAAAGAAGLYNHKVLIPEMMRSPDHPELSTRFRIVITAEAVALGVAIILTALLMGAAS